MAPISNSGFDSSATPNFIPWTLSSAAFAPTAIPWVLPDIDDVHQTHDAYIAADLASTPGFRSVRLFRRLSQFAQSVPKLRGLWNRTALRALYRLPGPDLPPTIRFHNGRWLLS